MKGAHPAWQMLAEMPRVDGIAEPLPQVTIDEVLRLHRLGHSAAEIAAKLSLSVMDAEHALRRVEAVELFSGLMRR
jgi:hypothetical protein